MKVKILIILLTTTVALPVAAMANQGAYKEKVQSYKQQQQVENKAFRKSLKDMPEDQREAAMIAHRNSQFDENLAIRATAHEKEMASLQTKLASNTKLTDAQKQAILAKADKEYQDHVAQAKVRHTENMSTVQSIQNDPNLTLEQKRAKIKEVMESNMADHQQTMMDKKENRGKFREWRNKK